MSSLNNSNNSNQQTLAESGANTRPPMLEKGNYIPWESRLRRFLDNQLEEEERMWHTTWTVSKTNVDACANAHEMCKRIKRLMHGSDIFDNVRHSRLIDEFDKFTAKEGESLESVYERLTKLVNIMDHNNVRPITVAINTTFLNCFQPEWSKYVTMVRQNQAGKVVSYDELYDSLVQFEPHVLASRAKKAAKNHDPLALIAHSNASSSHPHAYSSYSPQSYYVTHPPSVVDYDDEYQGKLRGDSQEDKLTTAMMLLAQAISQKFSSPTNNRLRVSSNIKNQTVVQDGQVDIQSKNAGNGGNVNKNCYNCNEKGHYARDCQKPKVHDAKYFREQMLLAMKDEAGSHLSNEENDFMLDNAYGEELLDELTASVLFMARLQPTDGTTDTVPSYDEKAVSHVHDSSTAHEQATNNGGTSTHDLNARDEIHEVQLLAYNVQREAKKQKRLNNELKQQKDLLQQELETFKDRVKIFESQTVPYSTYKETCDDLKHELRDDKNMIDRLLIEKDNIQRDFFTIENEKLIIQHETQLV
ncbi:putative RNA-directed DNA polymerase [Tanacetum coccineum]